MISPTVEPAVAHPEPPIPRLWPSVWKLLRLRLVILISGFKRAKPIRKIGMAILGLLILAGMAFVFFLSWLLLRFMRSPQLVQVVGDIRPYLVAVPVLILTAAFIGILLTSFGLLLQALYLAGDMDFLLSVPVPIRAVFITKLLQAILPNFGLILLFGLPVLFGLGISQGYNIVYYPLVLILLALLALAAAGISSLLVMLIVRVFPARRVAEVIGLFVGVTSFLCSQSGQFARYANVSTQQASNMLNLLSQVNSSYSPLAWAGRGLVDIGEGRWLSGFPLILLTLCISAGIFAVSLTTSEQLYYTGWSNIQGVPRKKKAPRNSHRAPAAELPLAVPLRRIVPSPVRAILNKDFLVVRRDLRNLSQLITPLILGVVYAFMLLSRQGEVPAGRGEAPDWFMQIMQNILVYGNVGISLFVGWTMLSRLAMMGFSQEGANYWVLKSAPVKTSQLLIAKFLVAFLPALVLGWAFLIFISLAQQAGFSVILYSLLVVAFVIAGTAGLNLAFGVAGANFEWTDPRHMLRGTAGCLGTIVTMAYLLTGLILFFGPPVVAQILQWPQVIGQAAGFITGGIFSLACAILPLWLVRDRVPHLGES